MKDEEELMGRLSPTAEGGLLTCGGQMYMLQFANCIKTAKYCSCSETTLFRAC